MVNNMRGADDLVLGIKKMVLSPERVAKFRVLLAERNLTALQWSDEEVEAILKDLATAVAVVRYYLAEDKRT
jgi:hypothetical protein